MPAFALVADFFCGLSRQQFFKGVDHPGVADDHWCPDFLTVGHAHAGCLALLDQDVSHIGVGEYLTTGLLNDGDDGFCDLRRTANRIEATVKVVLGNQRMNHKAGLLRCDAAIAPLAGDRTDQFLVVGQFAQNVPGGLVEVIR